MIFNKITLVNFGPFYGENVLVTQNVDNKNVTVVHGQNYVGKTSLLRAIHWCLYGEILPDDKGNEVDVRNLESLEEHKKLTSVAIEFYHEKDVYLIERILETNFNTSKSSDLVERLNGFKLNRIGHHKPLNRIQDFVYEIAPPALSKFFFLKGENSPLNRNEEDLSQSMKEILGFDLVTTAIKDLNSLEASIRRSTAKFVNDLELQKEIAKIDQLEKDYKENLKLIDQYSKNVLAATEHKHHCEEELGEYQRMQGQKELLNEVSREIENLYDQLNEVNQEQALWFRKGVFAIVSPKLLYSGLKDINTDIASGRIPSPYQETFIKDLLNKEMCICGRELSKNSEEFIRVEKLAFVGGDSRILQGVIKAKGVLVSLENLRESLIDSYKSIMKEKDKLSNEIGAQEKRYKDLEKSLGTFDDKRIQSILRDKRNAEDIINNDNVSLVKTKELAAYHKGQLEKLKESYKIKASQNTAAKEKLEVCELVTHLVYAIESINERLQSNAKKLIQEEMSKIVETSLSEFPLITITDRFTYDVGDDFYLSGGPKRVLDFAFTASILSFNSKGNEILKNTGLVIPLVVDSAFGETDEEYRKALANFLPKLSPQLIVLVSGAQSYKFVEYLSDKLANEYVLKREVKSVQKNESIGELKLNGKKYQTKSFEKERNRTFLERIDYGDNIIKRRAS